MRRFCVLAVLFLPLPGNASAMAQEALRAGEDWPFFLGPAHTGVSGETGLRDTWPENGPPLVWEKTVGTGYSAPSVLGHRLVLHHRVGDEEIIECMHAVTGKTLWQHKAGSEFEDPFGYNNGPRCSPVLYGDRCYTLGAGGHLACVNLTDGTLIWEHNLHATFRIPEAFFGVGCTPILEEGLLIVLVGGEPDAGVVAFDADNGKVIWQTTGPSTWIGVEQPERGPYEWPERETVVSYSSPIAVTIHGQRHLLCLLRHGLVSLDPRTGEQRFKYWFRPFPTESVNAARPVVVGDRILLSAAYRQGAALIQVNADGKGCTEVWRDRRNLLAHWSTPIVVDGYAYGFSGRHESEGELRCINMETGRVEWTSDGYDRSRRIVLDNRRGVFIDAETNKVVPRPLFGRGSKIKVGNRFIILGERGLLTLAEINPKEYRELARTSFDQIHYPAWTAPVLARKRLYLRCEDALICLDLAADGD